MYQYGLRGTQPFYRVERLRRKFGIEVCRGDSAEVGARGLSVQSNCNASTSAQDAQRRRTIAQGGALGGTLGHGFHQTSQP
jgi:hypothetical protein